MRYLFFDIEAADGFHGLCEFGVVITDEEFNILFEKLYLINPKTRFNVTGRSGRPDVELRFSKKQYKNSPTFCDILDNIKFVLNQKEIMVFGHSVGNDITYLRRACERYKLPIINFVAYDVQKMFSFFSNERRRFASLGKVVEELIPIGERRDLREHCSIDDAKLTMLTFKAMVRELGFTPLEMIEACDGCKIDSISFNEEAKKREEERRLHPELFKKGRGKKNSHTQVLWGEFYRSHLPMLEKEECIGRLCGISSTIKNSIDTTSAVIEAMKKRSLIAYDKIGGADYLVVLDEKDKERMLGIFQHPFNGEFIIFSDFINLDYVLPNS
jgi:hypothetical protein